MAGVQQCFGAITFTKTSGDLVASIRNDNGAISADIRGLALFDVFDGATNLGPVLLEDPAFNDPNLPFGNTVLLGADTATFSGGGFLALPFQFDQAQFLPPGISGLQVPALAVVGAPAGPINSPLLNVLQSSPLDFRFTFATSQDLGNGVTLLQYTLSSLSPGAAVPEPASVTLVFAAVILGFHFRGRRQA